MTYVTSSALLVILVIGHPRFQENQHAVPDQPGLNWGLNDILFDDLYLIELRNVAQGSWQPVLAMSLS